MFYVGFYLEMIATNCGFETLGICRTNGTVFKNISAMLIA